MQLMTRFALQLFTNITNQTMINMYMKIWLSVPLSLIMVVLHCYNLISINTKGEKTMIETYQESNVTIPSFAFVMILCLLIINMLIYLH